ncbi:lactosylceramide 4-alpha-galactosyltransferase-like [Scyliorhinus canicula]|uniref:lactosylceramide 4-alpha-galactosyltransferase-like n=1 Tax=Scyliorhinus canicula TaxID=7830 RepID=UPI0018F58C2A|nr:lactosylceramide 4-alpha-galactosyltransferase-like [Scyliorhinus canicula]
MKNQKRLCQVSLLLFAGVLLHRQLKFIIRFQQLKNKSDAESHSPNTTPGLMFLDSTSKVVPSALAFCSVESAARANPEKPIYYFMTGFSGNFSDYPDQSLTFQMLSSMKNIILLPLNLRTLFENTPLNVWYQKVDPNLEQYWIHVLSDACRIALLWKYGGIYLDTDIISLKPLTFTNFICAQQENLANGAALGFSQYHSFIQDCMIDYVNNYQGEIWGHQGPSLMSRVLRHWCNTDDLDELVGVKCNGISYLPPNYFYPIRYNDWEKYFEHWTMEDIRDTFSNTSGVHIWNFLSSGNQDKMNEGSDVLLEYFFRKYCPRTYKTFYTKQ